MYVKSKVPSFFLRAQVPKKITFKDTQPTSEPADASPPNSSVSQRRKKGFNESLGKELATLLRQGSSIEDDSNDATR